MENTINERLKAVRTTLNLSQRDFCKGIFLKQSSYARIETGETTVNERIIELVCNKYKVSKSYLKDGKGTMFSDTPPDVKLENLNEIFNELNPLFQNYLILQAKNLMEVQKQQQEQKPSRKGRKTQ
jgi:transcriptional regulator with XRE-family HTH domain